MRVANPEQIDILILFYLFPLLRPQQNSHPPPQPTSPSFLPPSVRGPSSYPPNNNQFSPNGHQFMLAKTIIQNLEDSQLIRIFLDFVQSFHLQYEKINKQISYKCHEATWILASTKATGYGRTESEAYKHALRNLLQILIEDPLYVEFFSLAIQKSTTKNNHSHSLTNSVNPFSQAKGHSTPFYSKEQLTEQAVSDSGEKEESIKAKHHNIQNCYKEKQSSSGPNFHVNHSNSNSKLSLSFSMNKQEQAVCKSKDKKQVYHSKINLNKYCPPSKNDGPCNEKERKSITPLGSKSKRINEQIQKAKARMMQLEGEVAEVLKQNQALKMQLNPENLQQKNQGPSGYFKTGDNFIPPAANMRLSSGSVKNSNHNQSQIKTQPAANDQYENCPSLTLSSDNKSLPSNANAKIFIPKLKLQILPNYHKKAEKSLNQSLLAVYNEKHGSKKMV